MIEITQENGVNTATGTGYVLVYTSSNVFIMVQYLNVSGNIKSIHNMQGFNTKKEAFAQILSIPLSHNMFTGTTSQIQFSDNNFVDGEVVLNSELNEFWEFNNGHWQDLEGNIKY